MTLERYGRYAFDMPKARKPTLKQKLFAQELIKSKGSATEAASRVYDVSSRPSAASIGAENLRKPAVKEYISSLLSEKAGLTLEFTLEKLREILDMPLDESASASERLQVVKLLLRLHDAVPDAAPSVHLSAHLDPMAMAREIEAQEQPRPAAQIEVEPVENGG